ncbi:MAG: hypothetical protein F4Z12_05190 [Acidobacteria bacterium]|nr:hypothetical protein [Acidobacteriota bacterium]MYE94501.1 hypothetical protein [Gemmatimonadota bacterium]
MAEGKLRFGKIIWRTRQQDHSDSAPDPAHRIRLQVGAFVDYVGDRSAVRIVVESHDADALLAYRAMWCQRLVEGVSYQVPTPPPGVRVWVEDVGTAAQDSGKTARPGSPSGPLSYATKSDPP